MAKLDQKELIIRDNAPPAYITTQELQQEINNSDTKTTSSNVVVIVVNDPNGGDGLDSLIDSFSFDEKSIRQGFIRKVYSLIVVQLLITCAVIAWFMNDQNLINFVHKYLIVFLIATLSVYLVTAMAIVCCEGPRRRVPYNYLFLFMFTLAFSALVGVGCSNFRSEEVLVAGGVTIAIFVGLTLFAFQTKLDFTLLSGSLVSMLLVLTLFGILMLFTPFDTLHLLYCALGVLLMCVYIVYDTQLMMHGRHRYSLSPEEYVFAALNLYIDIMYIFVRLLRLLH